MVGKVQNKNKSPQGGKVGRVEKKIMHSVPGGLGLEPRTFACQARVPSCMLRRFFRQASLCVPIDRLEQLPNTTCDAFWRWFVVRFFFKTWER